MLNPINMKNAKFRSLNHF